MATTTSAQMKAPATIEGVDSRISATNRTPEASLPLSNSERYTPARTPRGTANTIARPTIRPVPMNDWTIPPPGWPGTAGVFVKKSMLSAESPLETTYDVMNRSGSIARIPHVQMNRVKARSFARRFTLTLRVSAAG